MLSVGSFINVTEVQQMIQAMNGSAVVGGVVVNPLQSAILGHLREVGAEDTDSLCRRFGEIATDTLISTAIDELLAGDQPLIERGYERPSRRGQRTKLLGYTLTQFAKEQLDELALQERLADAT